MIRHHVPDVALGAAAEYSVDGDRPCNVMVSRSLVMLAAVWTNNASMSSSCCSVTSLIVAPLARRLARLGPACVIDRACPPQCRLRFHLRPRHPPGGVKSRWAAQGG